MNAKVLVPALLVGGALGLTTVGILLPRYGVDVAAQLVLAELAILVILILAIQHLARRR